LRRSHLKEKVDAGWMTEPAPWYKLSWSSARWATTLSSDDACVYEASWHSLQLFKSCGLDKKNYLFDLY